MKTFTQIAQAIRANGGKIGVEKLRSELAQHEPVFTTGRVKLYSFDVCDKLVKQYMPKEKPPVKQVEQTQLDRIEIMLIAICKEWSIRT